MVAEFLTNHFRSLFEYEYTKKMEEEFRIMTSDGNYREGRAGDYLMRGTDGDLFICQNLIFEKIYEFVQ